MMVDMPKAVTAPPVVTAVSNYTWCATRRTQLVASQVVGDAAALKSNTKLYRVDSSDGPQLLVLNAQRTTNAGGALEFLDPNSKLVAERSSDALAAMMVAASSWKYCCRCW
jgi:hypothetical protein